MYLLSQSSMEPKLTELPKQCWIIKQWTVSTQKVLYMFFFRSFQSDKKKKINRIIRRTTTLKVANFAVFPVSPLGILVTQSITVIFWKIVKLSACLFINNCSADLAHVLVQELSGFCSQESNPVKEINADNKFTAPHGTQGNLW